MQLLQARVASLHLRLPKEAEAMTSDRVSTPASYEERIRLLKAEHERLQAKVVLETKRAINWWQEAKRYKAENQQLREALRLIISEHGLINPKIVAEAALAAVGEK